jgi:hypothetical protein
MLQRDGYYPIVRFVDFQSKLHPPLRFNSQCTQVDRRPDCSSLGFIERPVNLAIDWCGFGVLLIASGERR